MIIIIAILFLISLVLLLWQISNIISVIFGSPYVVLDKYTIKYVLKTAGLKRGDIFYDLGCGNGQVLIEAAKLGTKAYGFEISPIYFLWAKIKTMHYKNIYIKCQNIKKVNLKKADVIYIYLMPELIEKIEANLKKAINNGSRIVSVGFPIKGLKQYNRARISERKIYLYKWS